VSTSVTLGLDGLSVPITLSIMSGEADTAKKTWVVDSRVDLRIPRRGPGATADAPPPSRIGLHDDILQAFLDGVPPQGAKRLKTTGSVPDTTVWQQGDDLYIRSRADIRDEFDTTLSSADGTHLWKLPVTPRVAFSVDGRTEALSIALE
jgi:intracellular multiplication protein IcmK